MTKSVRYPVELPLAPRQSGAAEAFDKVVEEYDIWYDNNVLFSNELSAIRTAVTTPRLSLEVGVGTGRFASSLGIRYGVDPAPRALARARSRGVLAVLAQAEDLPFRSWSLEGLYFICSLCFTAHRDRALLEAARVLRPAALLVIAFVPRESRWGRRYDEKKAAGHPLYRFASFLTLEELIALVEANHFRVVGGTSTLFQGPDANPFVAERPESGLAGAAGFVVLVGQRD